MKSYHLSIICISLSLLAACAGVQAEEIVVVSVSPIPSVTDTPRSAATGTSAPVLIPSEATISDIAILRQREEHILYQEDGNICLFNHLNDTSIWMNQAEPFANIWRVKISDDGKVIAFIVGDYPFFRLWLINADGTNLRNLVPPEVYGIEEPYSLPDQFEWIPGTHQLIFNTEPDGIGVNSHHDLFTIDADTNEYQQLLISGDGGKFYLSPDGKYLVMTQYEKILLWEVGDTSSEEVFTFPLVRFGAECCYYPSVAWAQDSQSIFVALPSEYPTIRENPDPEISIYHISIIDGQRELIYSMLHPEYIAARSSSVNFSPDANWIVFESGEGILLVSLQTKTETEYLGYSFVEWVDDSEHFVVIDSKSEYLMTINGAGEIYEMPVQITLIPPDLTCPP